MATSKVKQKPAKGTGGGMRGVTPTLVIEDEAVQVAGDEATHRFVCGQSGNVCTNCGAETKHLPGSPGHPRQLFLVRGASTWTTTCPPCAATTALSAEHGAFLREIRGWTDAPPKVMAIERGRAKMLYLLHHHGFVVALGPSVTTPRITQQGRDFLARLDATTPRADSVSSPAPVGVRHALLTVRDEIAGLIDRSVLANRRLALDDAGKVVQRHLDEATGAGATQVATLDAAICRIVAVAGRGGVREDEVLRFLEALELDVDRGETRLAALVVAEVLTWEEQKGRGKQDAPLVYRRGPAFGKVVTS